MSLSGSQINPIDVNFHSQKSLEIFDKNSAEKIWSKKDKEIKVSPLMPIRMKPQFKKRIHCKEEASHLKLVVFAMSLCKNQK